MSSPVSSEELKVNWSYADLCRRKTNSSSAWRLTAPNNTCNDGYLFGGKGWQNNADNFTIIQAEFWIICDHLDLRINYFLYYFTFVLKLSWVIFLSAAVSRKGTIKCLYVSACRWMFFCNFIKIFKEPLNKQFNSWNVIFASKTD